MHFYRPPGPIRAMSFDLDDTLYDNAEVILTTVSKTHQALQQWHPSLSTLTVSDYESARDQVAEQEPETVHDVTLWREKAVSLVMQRAGLSAEQCRQGTGHVMSVFARWRSAVTMPSLTHQTLSYLSQRIPLVAITNGNADPEKMGIANYFRFILRAGPDGRAKPAVDMYQVTAQRLQLPPSNILHVGDDLTTDVAGAVRSGFQACWINSGDRDLMSAADARLLPHLEISRLDSLMSLL